MSDSTYSTQSPRKQTSPQLSMATPPFLASLYDILHKEDPAAIGWCDDGKSFGVFNVAVLEAYILPTYYRHNNFSSFQRQLNYFGFRKILKPRVYEPCTFYAQPLFLRDDPSKMLLIKRKTYRHKGSKKTRRDVSTSQLALSHTFAATSSDGSPVDSTNDSSPTSSTYEPMHVDVSVFVHLPDFTFEDDFIESRTPDVSCDPLQPIPFHQTKRHVWHLLEEDIILLSNMINPVV
ncbi:unnamed protein product [Aphanomyces euteiches]|uniref:HSF-type DNA-binding domain-containing protein n=1 Tax=Aphanomyces euteiches TaxID=100861 RepID=A0A6G0XRA5_9STRA|nr:hypothetical protein Ae201684_002153 [Aphanomyces euteiches]KAH9086829.1 hypothetical protein Ae201684P_000247 [Aphanomyces euteiches]